MDHIIRLSEDSTGIEKRIYQHIKMWNYFTFKTGKDQWIGLFNTKRVKKFKGETEPRMRLHTSWLIRRYLIENKMLEQYEDGGWRTEASHRENVVFLIINEY